MTCSPRVGHAADRKQGLHGRRRRRYLHFRAGKRQKLLGEVNMGNAVYSTPIVANNTLFIANKSVLFAITEKKD